ncbi:Eco57I restriction-modification methylase domain-containing protein [uncultured Ruminococcus sp.]|uniref:Eco57I restriction-modification methylase domain-containing protein n=1 Tax=uncultured Ruminococcus sp. TaxID=165186 RepID=UPI00266EA16C|nr:N-6 DNA methylase [uncultured Ruminococcus sp.]
MKNQFCSFYTNSEDITFYMSSRLGIHNGDIILEPSAGEGIFIDEVLKTRKKVHIDALDINDDAISVLQKKYDDNPDVDVRKTDTLFDSQLDKYDISQLWLKQTDTLLDEQLDFFNSTGGHYTGVIGNPPYGAWQDYERRDRLKKKYVGQYVKETYSLFLLRCISVLKLNGRLSFIIPDTFLYVNMHTKLRELLLKKTKIEEIIIFPSKFFPGICFGYSNLCIITLERSEMQDAINNSVKIYRGFKKSEEFRRLIANDTLPAYIESFNLKQSDVLSNSQHRFVFADNQIVSLLKKTTVNLGDIADVVTGFYTGNNKEFIKAASDTVKGAKNYEVIDQSMIVDNSSTDGEPNLSEAYIPFIKSASETRYVRNHEDWYVRWDSETVSFYKADKKARFQNSDYYFKTGIGIPMVKSSKIKAFLMQNRVFDQSIVGIFPKDKTKLNYILALMNSDIINQIIHIINPTANNSANYIKLIPYIEPSCSALKIINDLVNKIFKLSEEGAISEVNKIEKEIDCMITDIYFKR